MLPLAEKYRPRRFDEVAGQDEAVRLLGRLVSNPTPPAVLLHGPSGTGKTSLARIYAMARNCDAPTPSACGQCPRCKVGLTPFDWHDFSGARWDEPEVAKSAEELLRQVPWGRFGVFIDEVHGLKKGAADVLLEEVERPRSGRFFICATTELESVRPALRSRCIVVQLRPVAKPELFKLAQHICAQERVAYEPGALDILVSQARGSARELVMALDAVATRGHLTPELLKSALSLGWTDQLISYVEALLAGDLSGQFDAIGNWVAEPREKAKSIKEFMLYVYNFEVSSPRIRDYVNAAFHLVDATSRAQIAIALTARAQAECFTTGAYWQQLLNFWLADPALLHDDASLGIKVHDFHRLITPAEASAPPATEIAPSKVRQREYRKRSQRAPAEPAHSHPSGDLVYLGRADVERLYDAASFLAQHHGRWFNGSIELTITAAETSLDRAASRAVTSLTHELGLRVKDWAGESGDGSFHWIYRNLRSSGISTCYLAAHVPYEHLEAIQRWLATKTWNIDGAESVALAAKWHDPKPPNPKLRQVSRLRFHWQSVRKLWTALDPAILHWASDGTRQPLRLLLGLKAGDAEASERMGIKLIGASRSLDRKARADAEANKMRLLSPFKDAAFEQIDRGWELFEYRDRLAEIERREEQLRRVEYIGAEATPLAQRRYEEEFQALRAQWPDDPKERPRTWVPWQRATKSAPPSPRANVPRPL